MVGLLFLPRGKIMADLVKLKSAGNRDVLQGSLQVLHIHVFLVAPLGAGHMAQAGADQHEGGITIRERPHHTGPAADLPVEPLNDISPAR